MKGIVAIAWITVMIVLVANCSNNDASHDTQPADLASGPPPDNSLRILFRWHGDDFATKQELEIRDEIGRIITQRQIGKVIRSGTGMGWMDIVIEVDEKDSARRKIDQIVKEIAPEADVSLR